MRKTQILRPFLMGAPVKAMLFAFVFAVGAFSQSDTARVPVKANVAATIAILPPDGLAGSAGATKNIAANATDTLVILIGKTLPVSYNPRERANLPVVSGYAGKISLNLPARPYKNAEISLYTVRGERVLRGKAPALGAVSNISRPNIAAGAYLLSVKGPDGDAFTFRHTHGGGSLNISVAFGNGGVSAATPLMKEAAGLAAGDWTITAKATGYANESRTFTPIKGMNPAQNFTLSPDAPDNTGFVPEMLGIGVGATTSEVRFAWYSDSTSANNKSFARIFDAGGTVVSEDSGEARGASKGKRYHKAVGKGLLPNTEYKYSVSNNKADWSRKYGFKTPGAGAFTFAMAGDMHQGYVPDPDNNKVGAQRAIEGWALTTKKIGERNVNFVASVGDHVDTADHDDFYKPFFAPEQMQTVPFAVAMGNHDINALFVYHFNLPNTTSRDLMITYSPNITWYGSYWYLYNNALFAVLNTGAYLIKSTAADKLTEAKAHVAYFDSIMTKAKNAHAGKYDWLIVQHHKSTQSVGAHAQDEEIQLFKQAGFDQLMDKHNVDLVFAGHDHIYVRTKPMKAGKVVTGGGTVYLTLPTASYTKFYPEESSLLGDHIAKYKKNNWNGYPGYGVVNVNGKSISAIVYNYDTRGGADIGLDTLSLSK